MKNTYLKIVVLTTLIATNLYAQNSPAKNSKKPSTEAIQAPVIIQPEITETPLSRALIRIDQLELQIKDLTNKTEIIESNLNKQTAENQRLAALIDKLNAAQIAKDAPKDMPKDANPINSDKINTNANTAIIAPEVVKAIPPVPEINASTLLNDAKIQIQNGAYQKAESKLNTLIEKFPNSPETPDAYYLLAETRLVQKAFNLSAASYIKYLEIAPNGPKLADSLIGLATSFRELGDNKQRCVAINEYKKRTPNPTAVLKSRADIEIARAPCP